MTLTNKAIVFACFGLLCGCNHVIKNNRLEPKATTPQLITPEVLNLNPKIFDGGKVSLTGWLEFLPEAHRLWQNKNAMISGTPNSDCVGLAIPESFNAQLLNESLVMLQGRFVADSSKKYIVSGGCINTTLVFVDSIRKLNSH